MKTNNCWNVLKSTIPFLFSIILTFLTYVTTNSFGPILVGLIELSIIFLVTNLLFKIHHSIANLIKIVFLLLYNIQMAVLLFSGTFVTLIMLTNLDSIEALSGNAATYLTGAILVLLFTIWPVKKVQIAYKLQIIMMMLLVPLNLLILSISQPSFSPIYSVYGVSREAKSQYDLQQRIAALPNYTKDFYNDSVSSSIEKPEALVEKPNVVLIFVEGMSQHIIDDSRNITPNISKLQKESLSFTNYFNHTFATYRGIQGQLFSGYQLNNYDQNNLVSIQSIMRDEGYHTVFLNSEPENETFSNYINELKFDKVTTSESLNGDAKTVSDKDLYFELFSNIESEAKNNVPFFITTYSFGTHVSLDSPDEKYGDGSNTELNKFYNLDYQFNKFMEKFKNSSYFDNTIIVFTTDHATFVDNAYRETYPDYDRNHGMVDEIPLFIYHKGIESRVIDVGGENSLSLAPTLLDYLDISAPNYFLGTTLFDVNDNNFYDTTFVSEVTKVSTEEVTDGSSIKPLSPDKYNKIAEEIEKYYAAKTQEPMQP